VTDWLSRPFHLTLFSEDRASLPPRLRVSLTFRLFSASPPTASPPHEGSPPVVPRSLFLYHFFFRHSQGNIFFKGSHEENALPVVSRTGLFKSGPAFLDDLMSIVFRDDCIYFFVPVTSDVFLLVGFVCSRQTELIALSFFFLVSPKLCATRRFRFAGSSQR